MDNELVVFMDTVSRTIIGKKITETADILSVENPLVLNALYTQDPNSSQIKIQTQLLPLFFKEFQGDKSEKIVWEYKKSMITLPTQQPKLDWKLGAQYAQITNPQMVPQQVAPQAQPQAPRESAPVIKLFED